MDVHKKHHFFVSFHTSSRWVNPACPAEPIFLIPMFLAGDLRAAPAEPASICIALSSRRFKR